MPSILLVPIPPVDEDLVGVLVDPLHLLFRHQVINSPLKGVDPSSAFDQYRNQYNSSTLIAGLLKEHPYHEGKVLGITSVDLFIPVLTYVFGEAQLDGPAAVVSNYRLDDQRYGLPANQPLLEERLIKESIHELGHTFGLYHCHHFDCVMHSSTTVEEIDIKGSDLCIECRTAIGLSVTQ